MRIGVLGINFKSAELGIREAVSKACQKRLSHLSPQVRDLPCVVLSTCNRTEIYFSAEPLAEAHSELLAVLREEIESPFEHKLYSYFGPDCFLHLAAVTSGLDSALVGESEVQRQVKMAYEQAMRYRDLPSCMHYLFQKVLHVAKRVRSHCVFSHNLLSLAPLLFEYSQDVMKSLSNVPILFIGNSEINRRVMAYFRRKGIQQITLCTRSLESARGMAEKEGLLLLPWERLSTWCEFPLVICGSQAPHYLVTQPSCPIQTQLVFDLSVPRTVDPALALHPQLLLLNMEELGSLIEPRQRKNAGEMARAETMISEGVRRHLEAFRQKENRVFVCA